MHQDTPALNLTQKCFNQFDWKDRYRRKNSLNYTTIKRTVGVILLGNCSLAFTMVRVWFNKTTDSCKDSDGKLHHKNW